MNLNILAIFDSNKEYEFDAELENHPLENQSIYRLHYIKYYRKNAKSIGVMNYPFDPFEMPNGMTREDGFKVLSYLVDFIEERLHLNPCSYQSVAMLNQVLNLNRLGFKKINGPIKEEEILDLFTIDGRTLLFKKSKDYEKYFEWYTEGVTFEEVKAIYENCHMEFQNLNLAKVKKM